MRTIAVLLALAAPLPAAAQSFSGPAIAIDGDTLAMGDHRVRLFGIDAPESLQTCNRKGANWACGSDATALLAEMVSGRTVECTARDHDQYGRIVASCRAGASDLGGVMVREGLAVALTRFSDAYVEAESRAKSYGMALWGSVFQTPSEFRAANPAMFDAPPKRSVKAAAKSRASAARSQPVAFASATFRNCAAARAAAGAAPLYRGQPGYGAHMDGDGDGIACEPPRR